MANLAQKITNLPSFVYQQTTTQDKAIALHVGDTFRPPPRLDFDLGGLHRYTPPQGLEELRERTAEHVHQRFDVHMSPKNIVITPGATAALQALVAAMCDQGDELLIAGPHWPLIAQHPKLVDAQPVVAPCFEHDLDAEGWVQVLSEYKSHKTKGLYINALNNPTGRMMSNAAAIAVAAWAKDEDLFLISDDVYDGFSFNGLKSPSFLKLYPEKSVTVGSASKAFGLAGARTAWMAGAPDLVEAAFRIHRATGYCAPRFGQMALLQCLSTTGYAWQEESRLAYQRAGLAVADILNIEAPQAGTFVFVDVQNRLRGRTLFEYIESLAQVGVRVAPGSACGDYPHHIRLCFSSAPFEEVIKGVTLIVGENS